MLKELVLRDGKGLVPRLVQREGAQELVAMADGDVRVADGRAGSSSADLMSRGAGEAAPGGQVAAGRSCEPMRIQTSTRMAPVPSASTDAIRSTMSSMPIVPARFSAKSDST